MQTAFELYTEYKSGADVAESLISLLRPKVRTKGIRASFRMHEDWRAQCDYQVSRFVITRLKRLDFENEAALVTYARTYVRYGLQNSFRQISVAASLSLDVENLHDSILAPMPVGPAADELIEHYGRTPLEREILTAISQGYTQAEIGDKLQMTQPAVNRVMAAITGRALKEKASEDE